ncbi:MAG: galactose-1-phosphate uridylyltransferase [Acidimicrobiia bacterium]|nr:MAG: galactose-1-phosphate uridylyltransferase [Acidimicrobiia bacterium]
MPELREDPITGRRVIVAPGRSARPRTATTGGPVETARAAPGRDPACPFCPGNEHETPPEVARYGDGGPDTPGWRVRAVPNLYPVVGGDGGGALGGAHEVVVSSPAHDRPLDRLDPPQARDVVRMLRDRAAYHLGRGRAHAQPFVNQGRAAGASIAHPHAQLVALDVVPPEVARLAARFADAGRDLVAEQMREERAGARAVLDMDGAALAWCPAASPSPWFVRCALRDAGARFDEATDEHVDAIADVLRAVLTSVRAVLGPVDHNVVVHTAARGGGWPCHWWVDVVPRTSVAAGFEIATGLDVCAVEPADAAASLREARCG